MRRHVSGPALELLGQAGLSPADIDAALEDLVWSKTSAILRSHHSIVQRIRQATGINVVQIARRSRCLLIEIEQHKDNAPSWQYREHTPRNCVVSCRGQPPDRIEIALHGALLEKLIRPALAMNGTIIDQLGTTGDG